MRVARRALAGFAGLVLVVFLGVGSAAAPAQPTPNASPAGARTVTLPTGDTFRVSTDAAGRPLLSSPAHVPVLTETAGGDLYVTPLSARTPPGTRYDVSALLRGGPAAAPPTVRPDFPMRTVTLDVTDENGQPYTTGVEFGGLALMNLDDDRAYYNGDVTVVDGVAKVSVPDGHYGAVLTGIALTDGEPTSVRVAFSDFTVAGGPATAAVDLRAAAHQITFGTPKPVDVLQNDLAYSLGSSETTGTAFATVGLPGTTKLYVSDRPAGAGVAHFMARLRAESPAGTAHPYLYDLTFLNDGAFSGDRHYRADPATLATVDTRYHSGTARTGEVGMFPIVPWLTGGFLALYPVAEPLARTEYLSTAAGLSYATQLITTEDASAELWLGYARAYRPGQRATVDWNQGPVGAGLPTLGNGGDQYLCPACRQDDALEFILGPLTDSDPTHYGWLGAPAGDSTPSSHLQLFQGTTKLADVTDDRFPAVPVGPDPATYRLVYDVTRGTGPSTASHTEWTFASQHSGATTVPDRWLCGIESTRDDCSALDLLTLHYRLPQTLAGTIHPGTRTLDLSVGHSTTMPAAAVTGATVAVSYDGGATWTPATVTPRGTGRYTASWRTAQSTVGSHVSVRVTASDAAGDTVTQTVTDAVTVAR
jgi:hypothetical protein